MNPQSDSEAVLERIWNKWTNIVTPPDIEKACFNNMKPLEDAFEKLLGLNIQAGFLSHADAYPLGQKTGELLAKLSRMSFMLGLEYGILDKQHPRNDDFVTEQAKIALPLIDTACKPTDKAISQLLGGLVVSKFMPKEKAISVGEQTGHIILNACVQCFRLGLNYSVWA